MGLCLIIKSGGGTDTSSATASAEQILSGYTIYKNDNKITGTMTNVGKQTTTGLNASGSATINAGWHDGTGSVTTNSLSSQTGGTSIAVGDVLSSYTYWSSGAKATGTMTSRGTKAWTIAVNGSQTIESGWHSGSGTVKQSSTVATNSTKTTMTPTTSQQTLCNASTYYSQERWCAGNANLTAANIKKDITIFGVKGTWQGWVDKTVWIIKDGNVQSGFGISNITQGASSAANWSQYQKTGKTSWGTWMIDGWYWKDDSVEGWQGSFDITGLNTLGISFVQISGVNYYRTNAKFSMDFNYYWSYTSNTNMRVYFYINQRSDIWWYTVADYNTHYGSGDLVSVPGGSCVTYDSGTTWNFYITVGGNYIKNTSITTLNVIRPHFDSRTGYHQTWQIKNLWVTRE